MLKFEALESTNHAAKVEYRCYVLLSLYKLIGQNFRDYLLSSGAPLAANFEDLKPPFRLDLVWISGPGSIL